MTAPSERAVLAGGWFWGMQHLLRRHPGVISTRVGYTGGDVPNATYRNHGSHAEAIGTNDELLDYIDTPKLRDLAWCGENGFEPIAIGAAA